MPLHDMDTRAFAATLLKVAGLVIIVYSLSRLPSFFPVRIGLDAAFSPGRSVAIAALNLSPPLLLGLFLWWFPGKIANKIITSEVKEEPEIIAAVERVAITILGLYLGSWGVSNLAYRIGTYYQIREDRNPWMVVAPGIISASVEIIVGLLFVLGARGIVNALQSFRARG